MAQEHYRDCHGVYFHEVRGLWLPEKLIFWPKIRLVKYPRALGGFNDYTNYDLCWHCNGDHYGRYEIHHIIGGASRSDELTNLYHACRVCHGKVQSQPEHLGSVLYNKWHNDNMHTNWVRLTLLYGKWLPELQP